jgi:hypothetical protein
MSTLSGEQARWLTLEQVSYALGKSKSQVSRDIRCGKLLSNGKVGTRALRIDSRSISAYLLENPRLQDPERLARMDSRRKEPQSRDPRINVLMLESEERDLESFTPQEQVAILNESSRRIHVEAERLDEPERRHQIGKKLRSVLRAIRTSNFRPRRKTVQAMEHIEAALQLLGC